MTEAAREAIGRARATYNELVEELEAKAPTEDLSSRAETMLRLVESLATPITLERVAFGIDQGGDDEGPAAWLESHRIRLQAMQLAEATTCGLRWFDS